MGDNLQKIRQRADDAYFAAANHPQFGLKLCLGYLTNDAPQPVKGGKGQKGKKPVLTSKHLKAKYELLRRLLESSDFGPDQQVLATKYAVKGIQHAQNDVRTPAYDCLCELYKQMGGDEISRYTEGLRQASLDTLFAKFQEIDENQGKPTKQPKKQPERRQTIETNIGKPGKPGAAQKSAMGGGAQNQPDYAEELGDGATAEGQMDASKQCDFCGRYDPNFTEESLDIHYWKECPMLTCCWECDQVIEIKMIEEHLLEECAHMSKYKYHPKCKQVLMVDEFDGHQCSPPEPPGAVRCPLCSENVYPNSADGWKRHLLTVGCQGNPRGPKVY